VVKGMMSFESKIATEISKKNLQQNCFQLFGTDLDVDSNLKVWLIESNVNPTLSAKTSFERAFQFEFIKDMINMLGMAKWDSKLYKNDLKIKIRETIAHIDSPILSSSNEDDISTIADFEFENLMKGGYERVFPEKETMDTYYKYLRSQYRSNEVTREWIKKIQHTNSSNLLSGA